MIGLGTLINTVAIIIGGIIGYYGKGLLKESHQESLIMGCGVTVLFIGIAGAMEKMLTADGAVISSSKSMFIVICILLGGLTGEILGIEGWFERFGEWLKQKSGNAKDNRFVEAFLTASFTVCIGAMAIVGAIQDGINGDYSILAIKAILDLIIIIVMTSTMGKGSAFSAIPVFILQGSVTLFARVIEPIMSRAALDNLSLVGSILIFCVGINLVWGKKIKVANFLPAIIFAVAAAAI